VNRAWLFLCTGFWLLFGALPAAAQVNLVISPIRAELQVAAGASETNVIQVTNGSGKPARVKVSLADWTMDRHGNLTFSRAGTNPQSCAGWIQINPTDFRLDPGTREVRYTITIPPGAKPGTYWTAVICEGMPVQENQPKGRRMAVHGRLAVVLYETLGNPPIKINFQDFKVNTKSKEPDFVLTLDNKGAGFSRLKKSSITIKNSQGVQVARLEVPDIPLLPGMTRELNLKANQPLPKGAYSAEAVLDVGRRDLLARKLNFAVGGK
jgi:P pilus assembly chaperone PapD